MFIRIEVGVYTCSTSWAAMMIALSFLSVQVNMMVIVCFDQTLLAGLITFKKIELCIFSTVLFTAISAGIYTRSINILP